MSENAIETSLRLRTIYSLLGESFLIPSYQRGYRWSALEVTQLLDDILAFSKDTNLGSFYCLQPIVVRSRADADTNTTSWEILDGQQRLTTIKIILKVIASDVIRRSISEEYGVSEFSIQYETRPRSAEFIENISPDLSNIDFAHMWNAYDATQNWFSAKGRHPNDKDRIKRHLLAESDDDRPVKVIWYEIDESTDRIDVFTRLNIGKIPLTNGELVKALFLRQKSGDSDGAEQRQIQIASEWDQIEYRLQDDAVWHFAYDTGNSPLRSSAPDYETRIEYILDLMAGRRRRDEEYATFLSFLRRMNSSGDHWLEVKQHFQIIEEWYEDNLLFHFVGFLIATGVGIEEIIEAARSSPKSHFLEFLRARIRQKLRFDEFDSLSYDGSERNLVLANLLFFNIALIVGGRRRDGTIQQRFAFDLFKKTDDGRQVAWDIEHVDSQTPSTLPANDRKWWAEQVLKYFKGRTDDTDSLDHTVSTTLSKLAQGVAIGESEFSQLALEVQALFNVTPVTDQHSMGNLVLLDAGTNRAYKNAPFPIKRMEILEREKNGLFVPLGTKTVFLKSFSNHLTDPWTWTEDDAASYEEAIQNTIDRVLKGSAE